MTEPTPEEARQLEELRACMRASYPNHTPSEVDAAVDAGVTELQGAKIRNFVPVLVERSARRRLDG